MNATYRKESTIDHTPIADVAAGAIVKIGGLICVATTNIPAGTPGALKTAGVFDITLKTGKAFIAGAGVYNDAGEATNETTKDPIGFATQASGDGVVRTLIVQKAPVTTTGT